MSVEDHVCIIGAGAWGTALAQVWSLGQKFERVTLLCRTQNQALEINETRRNEYYLPTIPLAANLDITADASVISRANHIAFVTPAQTFATLAQSYSQDIIPDATVVLCSKGIDAASGKTLADCAATALPGRSIAVLSGPSFAADVAAGLPTAVTLAHRGHEEHVLDLAERFATPTLRIYGSTDVAGVEAGGALKNVMALAVGVCRGLKLGASAEAALTTRGFAEMLRLATAMGGQPDTLTGLSGLGDLILTCSGPQSRNFAYGMALATNALEDDMPLAEGAKTAKVALGLARSLDIDVPIIETATALLDKELSPQTAVETLMQRPLRAETSP